jgi:dTDP-4-dehydrorhamnose reductase
MTRVLLTGTTGRLGSAFASIWEADRHFSVHRFTRENADFCEPEKVREKLRSIDFDVLVNTAALSGLEECLDRADEAETINTESPKVMAEVCREKNARLVHFSTDYVFGGYKPGEKSEADIPSPVNVYGQTKLAGEKAIMSVCPDAIIARVSWLFGPTPTGRACHFDHVLEKVIKTESQDLISDKFSMPTFTHDVVAWTEALLKNDNTSGVYHLCNTGEPESWHSSAKALCQIARLKGVIDSQPVIRAMPISEAYFFREQRPIHTAMKPARLQNEGIANPRHWLEAAAEYLEIR